MRRSLMLYGSHLRRQLVVLMAADEAAWDRRMMH
jgi:hypothetical protein